MADQTQEELNHQSYKNSLDNNVDARPNCSKISTVALQPKTISLEQIYLLFNQVIS